MEGIIPLWERPPHNSFVEQMEKDAGAWSYGRPTSMANDHLTWTLVNHQSVYESKNKNKIYCKIYKIYKI